MKKVLLVINPSSGGEQTKEFEQLAITKLESAFGEVVVLRTEKAGDAENFTCEAATEGYHSMFAAGGDGTVNEGISGIAEQEHRPNFELSPSGTVNDLAQASGIPLEPEEAINHFSIESVKPLDIGKINDDHFMNVVAIGSIPEAINDVDAEKKTKFEKLAYFMSGIKQLASIQSYLFHVEVNGKKKEIEGGTLLIGLTNLTGGLETLLPNAKVNDGKLHLVYLRGSLLINTLRTLPDLLEGVDGSTKNLAYLTCEQPVVSLVDGEELTTNVDRDEGDKLPVIIKVLSSHLQVHR